MLHQSCHLPLSERLRQKLHLGQDFPSIPIITCLVRSTVLVTPLNKPVSPALKYAAALPSKVDKRHKGIIATLPPLIISALHRTFRQLFRTRVESVSKEDATTALYPILDLVGLDEGDKTSVVFSVR